MSSAPSRTASRVSHCGVTLAGRRSGTVRIARLAFRSYSMTGVLQYRRRDAQLRVQLSGHDRQAGRAADEEQAGQLVRAQPAAVDDRAGLLYRALDQRPGDAVQLLAGQMDGAVRPRYRYRRDR